MNIYYTSKFERAFKKLPKEIQQLAYVKECKFRENLFDSSLRTHKLSWKLKNHWSFSVDFSYRILFEFMENDDILFLNIGDHDIYK